MNKKILWFDVETTGLDPVKNDIIQLAGLVEIDNEIKEEFNFHCQPFSFENVEPEALAVSGTTIEMLKSYPSPKNAHSQFTDMLARHCDKFDRTDKFYPAGYNARFDVDFLAQWFKKNLDTYLGSWINWRALDPLPLLSIMDFHGKIALSKYNLETVAGYFKVPVLAHDALSDIKATREIFGKVLEVFAGVK